MDTVKILQGITTLASHISSIQPHNWKGNDAPNTHHWDAGSVSASLVPDPVAMQTALVAFNFADGGVPHEITATVPLSQLGKPGPNEVITLDGDTTTKGSFVVGFRVGFDAGLYHRVICEFKFTDASGTKHDYRFDGDVG